jgi:hypothetical protein
MAATDLVYNTIDPVLYTPDYAFLKYALDKKQARYDQGLDAVSSAYNNLKRNLTDPTNKTRRDQFLNDAQEQLKKIASSDLSLGENINAANNVFDPLATNPAFIYDAYQTDRVNKGIQEMDDWAKSADMEVRKQYNPEIKAWLNRDLDSIRNGKGDIKNYHVQNRETFAAVDAQDILAKAAKDYGYTFKMDVPGHPYIVSVTGGTTGIPSYNAFAEMILGNHPVYQRQIGILGESREESINDMYKDKPEWASKSYTEKWQDYAKISYLDHRNNTKQYIETNTATLAKEDADLKASWNINESAYNKGKNDLLSGNNSSKEALMFNEWQQRTDNRNSLKQKLAVEQNSFQQNFGDGSITDKNMSNYIDQFSKSPRAFFKDQQYKTDVQTFTNIRAASTNVEYKEDAAYTHAESNKTNALKATGNMLNQIVDNSMDAAKLTEKQREFDLKNKLKGTKTVTNADGTISVVPVQADVVAESGSSTQLYMLNSLKKLQDRVAVSKANALNAMTSPLGALSLAIRYGMTNAEVGQLKEMWSKQANSGDPTKAIALTADQRVLLRKFNDGAKSFAANIPGNTFSTDVDPVITAREIPNILQKANAGYQCKNDNDIIMKSQLDQYFHSTNQMIQSGNALLKGKQIVIDKYSDVKTHPEFAGMFVNKEGGGMDIIGEKEVKSWLSPYLKGKDLDEAVSGYLAGGSNIEIKKPHYYGYQSSMYDPGTTTFDVNGRMVVIPNGAIFHGLPPERYNELTKKINSEIHVPEWEDQFGMMLTNPRFKLNGESKEDVLSDLMFSSQTNSNIWQYDGTGIPQQVKQNQLDLRSALTKNNITDVSIFTASPLGVGQTGMVAAVTYKPEEGKEDKKEFYSGHTYYFPINLNETSPKVFRRFGEVNDVGDFQYYKQKGQDFVMNAFEADGVKAIIHPNQPGDSRGTYEILSKWNPDTQSYGDDFIPMGEMGTYDESVKTIDQIQQDINETVLYPYVRDVIQHKKQVAKTNGLTTQPLLFDSFLK